MIKITTSLILCIFSVCAFAQRQASNWYFGYGAGLQFNLASNSVTAVNDGQLFTNEGCSSISDEEGNLLFYTDGTMVWNRMHNVMLNGIGLYGDNSSTQSAIIVPKPDDPNIYYIFTVDTSISEIDPNFGFNYSTVDMTLDGGMGGVTEKNVNLLEYCTEKLTAVLKDCLTKSIWVITFASENGDVDALNTFHAFEVSNTGVNNTSVKSIFPEISVFDRRGYLKVSPDGTKMANANFGGGLQVFDFNALTGEVTNLQQLPINNTNSRFPYGIEFSPNSKLLYAHASNDFFDLENRANNEIASNHTSVLVQFNMMAPDITASQIILDDRNLYRGSLQLGPNGKIYRALSTTYTQGLPYLGVINNPDNEGIACNYVHQGINLAPNDSSQGLPPFIASFFNKQIDIINNGRSATNLDLCEGDTYTLTSVDIAGASYSWTRDDVALSETDFELEINQSGHYEVYIDPNNGECAIEGDAFVNFNPNPVANNHTILQCDEDGVLDGFTLFNLNEANVDLNENDNIAVTKFYLDVSRTQEINGNSFANTSNPQIIYVEVINEATGCSDYSELTLEVSVTDSNDATIEVCDDDGNEDGFFNFNLRELDNDIVQGLPDGLSVSYFETYENALLEENNLGDSFINTSPYYQTIFARVENQNNCYGISEVELVINKLPNIETEAMAYYCLNRYPSTISINAGLLNGSVDDYTYKWSHGPATYSIDINEAKDYVVTVTDRTTECSKTRTVSVEPSDIASFNEEQPFLTNGPLEDNTVTIFAFGEGEYEYQLLDDQGHIYLPYQESNVFENVYPGIYSAVVKDVKNNCGVTSPITINVIGYPKFLTPNNDGNYDTWKLYGVSSMFQPDTKIRIFNRYGKLIKELNPTGEGWDGSLNGETLPPDDYWFSVRLQDGRIFKNHFTLKY